MIDFERFPVYIKSEQVYWKLLKYIFGLKEIDKNIKDQLRRASMSIILNIAEWAGKFSKKEKKNFYTISKGSAYECVAIIRIIKLENNISKRDFLDIYNDFIEIIKMLTWLINSIKV